MEENPRQDDSGPDTDSEPASSIPTTAESSAQPDVSDTISAPPSAEPAAGEPAPPEPRRPVYFVAVHNPDKVRGQLASHACFALPPETPNGVPTRSELIGILDGDRLPVVVGDTGDEALWQSVLGVLGVLERVQIVVVHDGRPPQYLLNAADYVCCRDELDSYVTGPLWLEGGEHLPHQVTLADLHIVLTRAGIGTEAVAELVEAIRLWWVVAVLRPAGIVLAVPGSAKLMLHVGLGPGRVPALYVRIPGKFDERKLELLAADVREAASVAHEPCVRVGFVPPLPGMLAEVMIPHERLAEILGNHGL